MGDVLWEMCKWRIAVFKSLFAFALLTYLSHENRLVKSLNDLAQSQGRKPNSMQNLIDPVNGGGHPSQSSFSAPFLGPMDLSFHPKLGGRVIFGDPGAVS